MRQPDNGYKSFVKIIAEVVRSYDNTKVLDSISSVFSFDILDKSTQQVLSMKVPVKQNGELKLRIVIYDLNKGAYEDYFVPLEINSTISRNDFAFTDMAGNIILKNYFNQSDSFMIHYKDPGIRTLWCKHYKRQFLLPAPPFSFDIKTEFDYTPDSLFQISVNDSTLVNLPEEGFYHLQSDTTIKEGGTIFRFESGYPNVSKQQQLLESLRYLTSKKEFEELQKSTNMKTSGCRVEVLKKKPVL